LTPEGSYICSKREPDKTIPPRGILFFFDKFSMGSLPAARGRGGDGYENGDWKFRFRNLNAGIKNAGMQECRILVK